MTHSIHILSIRVSEQRAQFYRLLLLSIALGVFTSAKAKTSFKVSTTKGCTPHSVDFALEVAQQAKKVEWHFGDGNISKEKSPQHLYTKPGVFTPYVVIQKQGKKKDTLYIDTPIEVLASPEISFSSPKTLVCEKNRVELHAHFKAGSSSITSYAWNMGNGTTYYKENIAHAYPKAGTYAVSLTATDLNGCKTTIEKPAFFTVQESQKVELTVTPLYDNAIPFTAQVKAHVANEHIGIKRYELNFGDGSKAPLSFLDHTYWNSGVYTITAAIEANNGCIGRASYTQIVNQRQLPFQSVRVETNE